MYKTQKIDKKTTFRDKIGENERLIIYSFNEEIFPFTKAIYLRFCAQIYWNK